MEVPLLKFSPPTLPSDHFEAVETGREERTAKVRLDDGPLRFTHCLPFSARVHRITTVGAYLNIHRQYNVSLYIHSDNSLEMVNAPLEMTEIQIKMFL